MTACAREIFEAAVTELTRLVRPREVFTCYFTGEESDFVRLNRNRVRQAGHVRQFEISVDLIEGHKHACASVNLSGQDADDPRRLRELVTMLRAQRAGTEADPYLLYATEPHDTEHVGEVRLPDSTRVIEDIVNLAQGMDLVGIWASGPLYAGFANSLGQRNWHGTASFNFDWSCHLGGDKAVKRIYAGCHWDAGALAGIMGEVRAQLAVMAKPARTLTPGCYRVYLAPRALKEILDMLAWSGFGLKSHRTARTPLLKMVRDERRLNPSVTMVENHTQGLAPPFTPEGFTCLGRIPLIEAGEYRDYLVSPRSSKEYGLPVNAGTETPRSLDMSPGHIANSEVLDRLDTGLYISNLWYGNFSNRNDCRITAMTRFACFWVENGELRQPVNVMRMDDSIYRMLGNKLLGLTREQDFLQETSTYGHRSTNSVRLPGALVEDLRFTL